MKNKNLAIIMVMIILISQLSMGITAFGEAIREIETTIEMTENTSKEEESETKEVSEESSQETDIEEITDENETNTSSNEKETNTEIVEENVKMAAASTRKTSLEVEYYYKQVRVQLGTKEDQFEKMIKRQINVKDNGKNITRAEYDIKDIEIDIDEDVIGSKGQLNYTIVPKDTDKYDTLRVTDKDAIVDYGDSAIIFETDDRYRSAAGFTTGVVDERKNNIPLIASSGKSQDNNPIDSSIGNNPYYKMEVFRKGEGKDYGHMEDSMTGDISHIVNGNEKKQDALKRWNNNKPLLNEGDMIRTWSVNPEYNSFYKNDLQVNNGPSHNGYTYYYLWNTQFREFEFSKMTISERTISQSASDEYLEKTIRNSFRNISDYIEEIRFDSLPDRKQPGKTTADITVREKVYLINSYIEYTFKVPFKVVEPRITVDFKEEMELPVGTNADISDPNDFIEAIYKDGKKENISDYDVELYTEYGVAFNNETVGNKQEMIVDIEAKFDEDLVYGDLIDLEFVWGDTIANKGIKSNDYDASISLLKSTDNKPYFSANNGTGLTNQITTSPRIEIYSESDTDSPKIDVATSKDQRAEDAKQNFQKALTSRDDFEYGDVLVYSVSNGGEILSSKGDNLISEVEDFNEAYYEITPKGYHLLRLNQMDVSKDPVKLGVDDSMEQVTRKLKDSLNIPNDLEDSRGIRYEVNKSTVDVSKPSTGKKATLNVYEKLQTNDQEFMTTYVIPYSVEQSIGLELQPITVPVGTNIGKVNPNDYITKVTVGDKVLNSSEYTASFEKAPNTNKVGSHETVIKIVTKNDNKTFTEKTQTKVIWGDSVGSSLDGTDKTPIDVSLSLLHENNHPYLVANEGNGLAGNASSGTYINIYRNSEDNAGRIFYANPRYVKGSAKETMEKWNEEFKGQEFNYGDILVYETRDEAQVGLKLWASRDEKLVKESVGYNKAFYEMTKEGYNLLHANKLDVDNNKLVFNVGDNQQQINDQAKDAVIYSNDIPNKNNFRFELGNVDTSKTGKRTGTLKIYEKLVSGEEFMTTRPVDYTVNELPLSVELEPINVPVGTKTEFIDPNAYVKKVVKGDKVLDPSEYTASFNKAPSTEIITKGRDGGTNEARSTEIKIETKADKKTVVGKTSTHITWGDTLTSKSKAGTYTATSVSLFKENNQPVLRANEGNIIVSGDIGMIPTISVYRNNINNQLLQEGIGEENRARTTKELWNKSFEKQTFEYGDVVTYQLTDAKGVSQKGNNTWVTRNDERVLETPGYDEAVYELTKEGYRLMHFNQLENNPNLVTVNLNTPDDTVKQQAAEMIVIPKHIKDKKDFRFELGDVDTKTSGKKKTQLKVYEKLASGGEFMTTLEVEYIVNPQLVENFYDEAGKEIKTTKKTNFDFGTSYQPEPENFVSSGNELYMYKGWLKSNEKPGTATPRSGKPSKVTKEDTVHYIYEKSEKQINMTIPTEMIFGTENGKDVTSKEYEIKNNSDKVKTEVSLNEFKKETSEVKLLTSKEKDPTKTTQSARLNLTTNGKTAVGSLNDTTKNETITTLNPGEKASMGISGNYFGSQKESARIRYNMMFKFTVIPE